MRKVKDYQRRDVGVLREQSGCLPVTSNDSQFTMFTKRERAIAVQLCRGFEPSFLVVVNVPHATLLPLRATPPVPISASGLTGQVDLASRRRASETL